MADSSSDAGHEQTAQSPSAFAKVFASSTDFAPIKRTITTVLSAPGAHVSMNDARAAPLIVSLCVSAVHGEGGVVVEDAAKDAHFQSNPFVAGESHVRFYASIPLRTSGDTYVGSLCVIDDEPHAVDEAARAVLEDMASIVVRQFELHQRLGQNEAPDGASPAGRRQAGGRSRAAASTGTAAIPFERNGHASSPASTPAESTPKRDGRGTVQVGGIFGDGATAEGRSSGSAPSAFLSEVDGVDPAGAPPATRETKREEESAQQEESAQENDEDFLNWKSIFDEELDDVSFSFDLREDLRKKLATKEPEEGEIALVGHLEIPGGETIKLPREPLHRALSRLLGNINHDTLLVSVQLTEGYTLLRITETPEGFSVEEA